MISARLPKKILPEQINSSSIREFSMDRKDSEQFALGMQLFSEGEYWHAHEAWEAVWRRHCEEERLFLQGIIQLAAAYHLIIKKERYGGALRNFEKARAKLSIFPTKFFGLDVQMMLKSIEHGVHELQSLGEERIAEFNRSSIPILTIDEK